ncbi:MAG: TFIIB-type zinc ribbon-containing protein [Planctomycetota bacterium]|jgi:DNA-directed RNA polymerase subunit RPC12/RpoP
MTAPDAGAVAFPCPSCGAGLRWEPDVRGLRCPFCGESRSVEDDGTEVLERPLAEALEAARDGARRRTAVRRVTCDSCAATVEVPATEQAGRCAYCGSSRVVEEDDSEASLAPECLVPFAIDADDARARFRSWIRSLWFRPNRLKSQSTETELRGVMVPFWTFDARAESSWTAMAGHHYYVPVKVGKTTVMQQHTRWVSASGSRADFHDDHLVCASRGLDAGRVRDIEPFHLEELVNYREEYLAGWAAESYAVDAGEGWGRAKLWMFEEQESRCAGDVPGDTHRGLSVSTTLSGQRYRYALLPVFVCAYRFRKKVYRFLVNGQTGEVQGEAPWSWVKITLLVLGIIAAVFAFVAATSLF